MKEIGGMRVLNDEEIWQIIEELHTPSVIGGAVAQAQFESDIKGFRDLLESHGFYNDFGGESAKIYHDSLVKTLSVLLQLVE